MLKFDQFVRSEAHTDFVSRLLKYQPVVDRPVSERPFSVLEIGCGAGADIKGLREALLTSGLPPPSLRFVATDRAFPGSVIAWGDANFGGDRGAGSVIDRGPLKIRRLAMCVLFTGPQQPLLL